MGSAPRGRRGCAIVGVVTADDRHVSSFAQRWSGPSEKCNESLELLVAAGCALSPGEIAARVGLSRRAVGEHLQRLWAAGDISPEEAPAPHAGGRFRERRWKAGRGIAWRPSKNHKRLLYLLGPWNDVPIGAENLAEGLKLSKRKVTVMLNDLFAAGWVARYETINRSDRRLQIAVWRRSPYGDRQVRILRKPSWLSDEMAVTSRRTG